MAISFGGCILILVISMLSLLSLTRGAVMKKEEMLGFFKGTYIMKQPGYVQEVDQETASVKSKKLQYAHGFNPQWNIFRLHHVCIRGGKDGIITGIEGENIELQSNSPNELSKQQWNDMIGSKFNSPMTAEHIDKSLNTSRLPSYFSNSTLFMNCNRQHSMAFNPSQLLLHTGFVYELSNCVKRNLGRHQIFEHRIELPFKQIFMHQCPNPVKSKWDWGRNVIEVLHDKLISSSLIKRNHTSEYRRGIEHSDSEVMCFEDLYASVRANHWIEGTANTVAFRRDIALKTGEPSAAKTISERSVDFTNMYQSYCTPGQAKPTSAKIKIFQRTDNVFLRSIVNLKEVQEFIQLFSTQPVELITATEKQTLAEQVKKFNDFDILISVHGSHLVNGLFTMHPYTKAVVEIVPFAYDSVYYRNYVGDLGFADYIVSTGHLTPNVQGPVPENKRFCAFPKYSDFDSKNCKTISIGKMGNGRVSQEWLQCPPAYHSRACDLWVNITTLAKDMNNLIQNNLCSLSSSEGSAGAVK